MNINELFEEIQDEFIPEQLNGEFLLQENLIVWSYNLDDEAEEIEYDENEDDNMFGFESLSGEELLLEAYREDIEKFNDLLDRLEEIDNWTLSETETVENIISFNILKNQRNKSNLFSYNCKKKTKWVEKH